MKAKALKSAARIEGSMLSFEVSDLESGETGAVKVDLTALKGDDLLQALAFAVRTKLRNATGGRSFEDAVTVVRELADALSAGRWTGIAREPGESRASPLIRAIAAVLYGGDTARAQNEYDAAIAQLALQRGIDMDAEDDATKTALRQIKAAYRKKLEANPAIKREMLRIELEAQEAALARKREQLAGLAD